MIRITDYNQSSFFYPQRFSGLENLIRFPDSEFKREGIPNSTVWIFNAENHHYVQEILADDVGCGMALFMLDQLNHQEAAEKIYHYFKDKNILGRGNHFCDICAPIEWADGENDTDYTLLLLHSDGKILHPGAVSSVQEALEHQHQAESFRQEIGDELASLLHSSFRLLGNWTHNSVEESKDKIIYRKGVIKTVPEQIHLLPAHLGAKILVYSVKSNNLPPYSSFPHATGRCAPRGESKVSVEEAASLREMVYIPAVISDSSLRTEHPSCYNNFDQIFKSVGSYLVSLGEIKIKSYVGKV